MIDTDQVALDEAVQAHSPRPEDALVTRWVLVTETVDAAGEPHLGTTWGPGMTEWQAASLLFAGLNYEGDEE